MNKKLKRILAIGGINIYSLGTFANSSLKKSKYSDHPNPNHNINEVMYTNIFGAPYTYANPSKPIVITADSNMPEDALLDIERAVDRLNEVSENLTFEFKIVDKQLGSGGHVRIKEFNPTFLNSLEFVVQKINKDDDIEVYGQATLVKNFIGVNFFRRTPLYINPVAYDLDMYQLTLHETMHFLGFRDVNEGWSIMRGNYFFQANDLTPDDIQNINYYYSYEFVYGKQREEQEAQSTPLSNKEKKDVENFLFSLQKDFLSIESNLKASKSDNEIKEIQNEHIKKSLTNYLKTLNSNKENINKRSL